MMILVISQASLLGHRRHPLLPNSPRPPLSTHRVGKTIRATGRWWSLSEHSLPLQLTKETHRHLVQSSSLIAPYILLCGRH